MAMAFSPLSCAAKSPNYPMPSPPRLFRQSALDALSTPEQLDRPLPLIPGSNWALLLALLGFASVIAAWSVVGRIPIRLGGRGVLITPNSLKLVQSEVAGRVTSMHQQVGSCVARGSLLVSLTSESLGNERKKTAQQLLEFQQQDRQESEMQKLELFGNRQDLARIEPYRASGSITEQAFVDKELALKRLQSQIETDANRRRQQIMERQLELQRLDAEIRRSRDVVAPTAGCINDLRVQLGSVVQPGQALVELNTSPSGNSLVSLAFFPAKDAKRIKVGQSVQVTPNTTNAQRHGAIPGTVVSVQALPVSDEALLNRLGSSSLVKSITAQADGPLLEVQTQLRRNPNNVSGYDWGGGAGPQLRLTSGTPTEVRVLVEQRQPISYLVPILRDLSGIY
jgi:HlyD family secretion protein